MSTLCIRCLNHGNEVRCSRCQHNYCLDCIHKLYIENRRQCILGCTLRIQAKTDILPFFHSMKNKQELYDNHMYYSERKQYLDTYFIEHKQELRNTFIENDKRYCNFKGHVHITLMDFSKVKNDTYLVYEIYEHKILNDVDCFQYDSIVVSKFLIYYEKSKICFVYHRQDNYINVNEQGYFLYKIIRDIEKETLDQMYLHSKKSFLHQKLLKQSPECKSTILNPDGYVRFPSGFEQVHRHYVNCSGSFDKKRKLHCFQNYRWIHFVDMVHIERKYLFTLILQRQEFIGRDMKREILMFL